MHWLIIRDLNSGDFARAWVFDNDPQRVGETVNGVEVRHINDMIACLRRACADGAARCAD